MKFELKKQNKTVFLSFYFLIIFHIFVFEQDWAAADTAAEEPYASDTAAAGPVQGLGVGRVPVGIPASWRCCVVASGRRIQLGLLIFNFAKNEK